MYLRSLMAAVLIFLPTNAWATCFDSPTWQGQPLSEEYIEQIEPLGGVRQAHLKMLRLAKSSADERREELRRQLTSAALLQYDGNRGELRKTLVNGTMLDIVESIDASRLNSLNRARLIEIYWLNGCMVEVLNLLEKGGSRWTSHSYLPIATGNAQLIFSLANRKVEEGNDYQYKRLRAFGSLIENPETAADTLREFLDDTIAALDGKPTKEATDFAGLTLALSLTKNESSEFEQPTLPPNPSQGDFQTYYAKWASVAAWASAAGHCNQVEDLIFDLLDLPEEALRYSWSMLEAVAVRCFSMLDE